MLPANFNRLLVLPAFLMSVGPAALAGPYMGIQYKSLAGTRSTLGYHTNQVNVVVGYEIVTDSGFRHALEYAGALGSSSGQIGPYNVETTVMTYGYKLMYQGFYAKFAYAKLDRDDRDLELTSDRARVLAIGYEHAFNPTTSIYVAGEAMRNSNLKMRGYSVGANFRF